MLHKTIKNRRTHQDHDAITGTKIVKPSLFNDSGYQSKLENLMNGVPENLQMGVRNILESLVTENMSDQEKLKRAKIIVKLSQQAEVKSFINEMITDEATYQKNFAFLSSRMDEIERSIKSQSEHDPSFLAHLAKTVGTAMLGNMFPGLSLLAFAMPVAAASVPGVQWYAGQPTGGEDMCLSNANTCAQGFLAHTGKPDTWFSQFSRNIEVAVAGGSFDTSLASCLSVDNVGSAVANFFNANSTNTTGAECIANSQIINNNMAAIRATNLPLQNDCSPFTKAMDGLYQNCNTFTTNTPNHTQTIIIASVAGAVGVAALVSLIVCCCKKKCAKKGYTAIE